MNDAYALLLNRSRLILVVLSLLIIAEIGMAFTNIISLEHEGLLRWLLVLTTLAWTGVAGLVGVTAPVSRNTANYLYLILGILSLIVLSMIIAMLFEITSPEHTRVLHLSFGPAMLTWMTAATLAGVATLAYSNTKMFSTLIIVPLSFFAWYTMSWFVLAWFAPPWYAMPSGDGFVHILFPSWLAMFLLIGILVRRVTLVGKLRTPLRYVVTVLASFGLTWAIWIMITIINFIVIIYLISLSLGETPIYVWFIDVTLFTFIIVAVLMAAVIESTKPLIRRIVFTVISACVMIFVVGWYWYFVIGDGLHTFAEEERTHAEAALNRANCSDVTEFIPTAVRVVKEADGQFHVLGYTWWGLSVCPHLRNIQ